ncbi:MAG: biotin/lipoyl-containing protein [Candidatus Bathyarchaeia archaeon]
MKRKFRVKIGDETFIVEVEEIREEGEPPQIRPISVSERPVRTAPSGGLVLAPMPGVVAEVRVKVGDAVKAGAPLLVLEAMKMENEIFAPLDGVVKEVYVEVGARVGKGERLLLIS